MDEEKLNKGWKDLYPHAEEKGNRLKIITEVDADHTHDLETQRFVTGNVPFLNETLQNRYSKQQHTVETSGYGSELVTTRIAVKMIMEHCYKLRMLGVSIFGMPVIYGDNMTVITNGSISGNNIKKKHHACAYLFIREA